MKVTERIIELMQERGWTKYKLAKECGVYSTTVKSWFKDDYSPSLDSLQNICNAFGITMAEFFSGIEDNKLTTKQLALLEKFNNLSETNRIKILEIMDILSK